MFKDTNGDVVLSWSEIAELNHARQVDLFGWCSCEDGEPAYEDCEGSNE